MDLQTMTKEMTRLNGYESVAVISTGDAQPDDPMPIKAKPYAHQIIGYNMACRILRITKGGD